MAGAYGGMNSMSSTANDYLQMMQRNGTYLELARAIYQQNPLLDVTQVYQRVHQYINMQVANRQQQQQQMMVQQQMQAARALQVQQKLKHAANQSSGSALLQAMAKANQQKNSSASSSSKKN